MRTLGPGGGFAIDSVADDIHEHERDRLEKLEIRSASTNDVDNDENSNRVGVTKA